MPLKCQINYCRLFLYQIKIYNIRRYFNPFDMMHLISYLIFYAL